MKVLEAARLAPSAMNQQPYIFVVTSNREIIKKISSACNQQWYSTTIIAICSFPDQACVRDDGEEYWKVDAAVAMTNLSLLACAEGLGTCWIAAFKEDQIKQILGIQKGRVVAMTPLGYAVEEKSPVTNRKSLDELVQFKNM